MALKLNVKLMRIFQNLLECLFQKPLHQQKKQSYHFFQIKKIFINLHVNLLDKLDLLFYTLLSASY